MANIPIHNETEYTLTDEMAEQIRRDAQEQFGEAVHSIRVQSGLERHALNTRTHEVRYAFSPQDFGFGPLMPNVPEPRTPEPPRARRRSARSDTELEADLLSDSSEDVEEDVEDTEPHETSLESLDEGQDDEEEQDDVFLLDDQNADEDDEEDQEDDEDDNVFDPDEDEV